MAIMSGSRSTKCTWKPTRAGGANCQATSHDDRYRKTLQRPYGECHIRWLCP